MREPANPLECAEDPREFEKQVEKPLECFMKETGDQLYGSETSLAQAWVGGGLGGRPETGGSGPMS